MASVTTLSINTHSLGTCINSDSVLNEHYVSVVVTQKNRQQELTHNVILENTHPIAKLSVMKSINS